jgi:thiol-disulfide isomerase/thioredoxin
MNLKDLVPQPELCKMIPEGEFADSALYWATQFKGTITDVFPRECGFCDKFHIVTDCIAYPAPTLQEILKELDEFEVCGGNISDEHTVVSEFVQYEDENTATAAMKVWLKLKGIKA